MITEIKPQTELKPTDRKHWNTPQKEWTPWPQEKIDRLEKIEDFIAFFQEIPVDKWYRNHLNLNGQHCARAHLGTRDLGYKSIADIRLMRLAPEYVNWNNWKGAGTHI